jgi:hypothetical protein
MRLRCNDISAFIRIDGMREEDLAAIARDLNGVPATASRTARLAPIIEETNTLVREAADALVTLDSTPLGFQAFKIACEPAK